MCGIFGAVAFRCDHAAGLTALRRRGPDGLSFWQDHAAQAWLGHARLAIIDPTPAGDQPMVSPDGRIVMIYNGEIYNFRELRQQLLESGEVFHSDCDSEVILRLFARDGVRALTQLNGIFAAAFFERDTGRLTLVRDPLGIKPLYYTVKNGGIAFASEMKSLIRSGAVEPDLDSSAVMRHIGLLWAPGEQTLVKNVSKLPPGVALTFANGQMTSTRYSTLSIPPASTDFIPDANAPDTVREVVSSAVERQLVSDVPLGSFLSGGLDSSAVVAFAARHQSPNNRLQTFSIAIDGEDAGSDGFSNDLPFAQRVAKHLNVDLNIVSVSPEALADRLAETIYFLDEPTADPAPVNALFISELARSQGIKVLMSGAGGDDVFTGYRRHTALAYQRWWDWTPAHLRGLLSRITAQIPSSSAAGRRARRLFADAAKGRDERLVGAFAWLDADRCHALLNPDRRQEVDANSVMAPLFASLADVGHVKEPIEQMLHLERMHFLADHNLNYTDKTGMAAGVEVRVPLLDNEVVELSHRLSAQVKQRGTTNKWVFKRAMEGILPHDVIYRPKTGFGAPLRHWLSGPLRDLMMETLSPERLRLRGLFDHEQVTNLVHDNERGKLDATYPLFAIICIEIWARQYVDNNFVIDSTLSTNHIREVYL